MISPSLLSADFGRLAEDIQMINDSDADWLHLDIMDGVFVPSISFGEPVLRCLKKISHCPLDVHLMVSDPLAQAERYAALGVDGVTFHAEACDDPIAVINKIKEYGCRPGIAVKPGTPVKMIEELIPLVGLVLIMTVEPGSGGQELITETLQKIEHARSIADDAIHIQVDGGINEKTAPLVRAHGADVLVSGSYLFKGDDMAQRISGLRSL